jgi:hypothetical protein
LPPERLARVIDRRPESCRRCHPPLPEAPGPSGPAPTWHQVAELPALAAEVIEYRGCGCADAKVAAFCANLLSVAPALWRFVVTEGLGPTNNHAERRRRRGVLWRKNAFGSGSERGPRFVERLLTVVQTRRLQKRPVSEFLYQSLVAHRDGLPAPELLPAG